MEGETGVSKTALTRMLFILKNEAGSNTASIMDSLTASHSLAVRVVAKQVLESLTAEQGKLLEMGQMAPDEVVTRILQRLATTLLNANLGQELQLDCPYSYAEHICSPALGSQGFDPAAVSTALAPPAAAGQAFVFGAAPAVGRAFSFGGAAPVAGQVFNFPAGQAAESTAPPPQVQQIRKLLLGELRAHPGLDCHDDMCLDIGAVEVLANEGACDAAVHAALSDLLVWYIISIVAAEHQQLSWTFHQLNVHAALTPKDIITDLTPTVERARRVEAIALVLDSEKHRRAKLCIFLDEVHPRTDRPDQPSQPGQERPTDQPTTRPPD